MLYLAKETPSKSGRDKPFCASHRLTLRGQFARDIVAIKIKIPKGDGGQAGQRRRGLPRDPVLRAALVAFLILAVSFTIFFSYFYIKYDRIIQRRFRSPVFSNSADRKSVV